MNIKTVFLVLIVALSSCSKEAHEVADTIYINGNIITIDDNNPAAEAALQLLREMEGRDVNRAVDRGGDDVDEDAEMEIED